MITRKLSLSQNITAFCQYLRRQDFTIGPAEEVDALLAIQAARAFEQSELMKLCLQTVLCKTPKQLERFPQLYQHYWKELNKAVDSKRKEVEEEKEAVKTGNKKAPSLVELKNWLFQGQTEEEGEVATYSAEGGAATLPATWSESELMELRKLIRQMIKKVVRQPSRRYKVSRKKKKADIRSSFRQSLKFGLDIFPLQFKEQKKTELKISIICDVSKSMEWYSRFVLQFAYAFRKEYPKIEAFAFDTRLHYLSPYLEADSLDKGLEAIARNESNWGGGTKIGASLDAFRQQYGQKMLSGKSMVIILSDGWDTGDLDLLAFNMRYLQRRSKQLIWINPLAGHPTWTAEVRGMALAMEYVDTFVAAYDLESLRNGVGK